MAFNLASWHGVGSGIVRGQLYGVVGRFLDKLIDAIHPLEVTLADMVDGGQELQIGCLL
ncbi:hypothetical protein [Desulfonatronum thioautotrophicum]|uniref:hypothetical protein n=1 Tax=Desulfonatronum thioautotrophicum TaxID=617001 RepID=UPI0012946DE2|nr:hypothetical protein [Desulfonatronum thioautotrophicum]